MPITLCSLWILFVAVVLGGSVARGGVPPELLRHSYDV
jgi:hypothetical protein